MLDSSVLTLSIDHKKPAAISLGTIVELTVRRSQPEAEARIFLRQGAVFYPLPIADWGTLDDPLKIFPESPGPYSIEAQWRLPSGERGRQSLTFHVTSPDKAGDVAPTQARLEHFSIWAPNAFEARTFENSDREVSALLSGLVKSGDTVYDIGANVGFYAAHLARLAGDGQIFCFEANPVCAHFLRTNLLELGLDQATVLPTALLHLSGMTRFNINYGNTNLGLVESSGFFHLKPGQEIAVSCHTLDFLVEDLGLPIPDFIKLDVEGAELLVLDGMKKTLEHRPTFLLELHGASCTQAAIRMLGDLGYQFESAAGGPVYRDVASALQAFGVDNVYQVVARP